MISAAVYAGETYGQPCALSALDPLLRIWVLPFHYRMGAVFTLPDVPTSPPPDVPKFPSQDVPTANWARRDSHHYPHPLPGVRPARRLTSRLPAPVPRPTARSLMGIGRDSAD